MRIFPLIILIPVFFYFTKASAQNDSLPFKNLKIYSYKKEYRYRAVYIDSNGDTITDEKIIAKPTGKQYDYQKTQTWVDILYNHTSEDSIKFSSKPVNQTKYTKRKNLDNHWCKTTSEGAIETNTKLWTHPFRSNQYILTEIAPFPDYNKALKKGMHWESFLWMPKQWGTFKGIVKSKYTVDTTETKRYKFAQLDSCRKIVATSYHKKLGENQLVYYCHNEYGFVELNYLFYNKQRINFILEDVLIKE